MASWDEALEIVVKCIHKAADGEPLPWLIVGSVASVLQGCSMDPRDLDILFTSVEDLERYVRGVASRLGQSEPEIISESYGSGFEWHKAQHTIDGFVVDAVYIASGGDIPDSIEGCGAWEGGPYAWEFARTVPFRETTVQVTPLEIQLESQLRRGRDDRSASIVSVLKSHAYDATLLKKCLSSLHYDSQRVALEILPQ